MRYLLVLVSCLLLSIQAFAVGSNAAFYESGKLYQANEISMTVLEHVIPTRALILVNYKNEKIGIIDPSGLKGNDYCHDFVSHFENDLKENPELLISFKLSQGKSISHNDERLPVLSKFRSLKLQ